MIDRVELTSLEQRRIAVEQDLLAATVELARVRDSHWSGPADIEAAEQRVLELRSDLAGVVAASEAPKVMVRDRAGVEVEAYGRDTPTPERQMKGDMEEGEHLIASRAGRRAGEVVYGYRGQEPIDRYAKYRLISTEEYRAAVRLRTDWEACRIAGRVTARYSEPASRGAGGAAEMVADARRRYVRAMTAVGPMLAPVLVHVVCMGGQAADWASLHGARGKRAETRGIDTLVLALGALAIFYGLRSPPPVVLPQGNAEPAPVPSVAEILGTDNDMWVWVPAVGLTGRPMLSLDEKS